MVRKSISFASAASICLLAAVGLAGSGNADENCEGSVAGSVLAPLPAPVLVQLDEPVEDSANPALARRLISGLQRGGVAAISDGAGNVGLSLAISLTPPPGNAQGPPAGTYRNLGWVNGEVTPTNWNVLGMRLSLSAEATDLGTASLAWVGTAECTVTTETRPFWWRAWVLRSGALSAGRTQNLL